VVAVGCSADGGWEGAAGEGEIGSVEQALGGTNPSVAGTQPASLSSISAAGRYEAASCVIQHGGIDKLLVGGGFLLNGTPVDDLLLYNPSNDSWSLLAQDIGVDRGALRAIKTGPSSCVFVGGATAPLGNAVKDVDEVSVSGTTVTVTHMTDLTKARAYHAVSLCGNQIMAFGGHDNAQVGAAKFLRSIERSDDLTPGSWTDSATALGTGRHSFGFSRDDTRDRYVLTSGATSSNFASDIEVVTTSSCAPSVTSLTPANAITAGEGLVTFYEGTEDLVSNPNTSKFVIAGGTNGTATAKAYELTVSWASPPTIAVSDAAAPDLNQEAAFPALVKSNTSNDAHMVLGGLTDNAGNDDTFTTNAVQQYEDTFSEANGFYLASLTTGRFAAVAEKIGSVVYVVTGLSRASGVDSAPQDMDKIPP